MWKEMFLGSLLAGAVGGVVGGAIMLGSAWAYRRRRAREDEAILHGVVGDIEAFKRWRGI